MTNFEKYKEELLRGKEAIDKRTNKPEYCWMISCDDCKLDISLTKRDCTPALVEWGLEEAAEEIKLTERQKAFCQMARTGWLAKDKAGGLRYFYGKEEPPTRSYKKTCSDTWMANGNTVVPIYIYDIFPDFPFITWESGRFSIEELLNKYC